MTVYCNHEHEITGAVIVPFTELVLFAVDASLVTVLTVAVLVYSVVPRILLFSTVVTSTYHDCPADKLNKSEVIVFEVELSHTETPEGVIRFVDPLIYENIEGKTSLILIPLASNHPIFDISKRKV